MPIKTFAFILLLIFQCYIIYCLVVNQGDIREKIYQIEKELERLKNL